MIVETGAIPTAHAILYPIDLAHEWLKTSAWAFRLWKHCGRVCGGGRRCSDDDGNMEAGRPSPSHAHTHPTPRLWAQHHADVVSTVKQGDRLGKELLGRHLQQGGVREWVGDRGRVHDWIPAVRGTSVPFPTWSASKTQMSSLGGTLPSVCPYNCLARLLMLPDLPVVAFVLEVSRSNACTWYPAVACRSLNSFLPLLSAPTPPRRSFRQPVACARTHTRRPGPARTPPTCASWGPVGG